MKKILNFGSLNIDFVYKVPHFVRPGETLQSISLEQFAGGKGANQSVALAKAGAEVFHAGKVGHDGLWLKEKLHHYGVDVTHVIEGKNSNGHAMIQVDKEGQNAIILYPGTNKEIEKSEIEKAFAAFNEGDYLLLQNEINLMDMLIKMGHEKGLKVCFNPAPMDSKVLDYPLECVSVLIVNETEGCALAGTKDQGAILKILGEKYPHAEILLTTGSEGASYFYEGKELHLPAEKVQVVDTTAAGDTFIGYFLAEKTQERPIEVCLQTAMHAAAKCVTKEGAMDSIPSRSEL